MAAGVKDDYRLGMLFEEVTEVLDTLDGEDVFSDMPSGTGVACVATHS